MKLLNLSHKNLKKLDKFKISKLKNQFILILTDNLINNNLKLKKKNNKVFCQFYNLKRKKNLGTDALKDLQSLDSLGKGVLHWFGLVRLTIYKNMATAKKC